MDSRKSMVSQEIMIIYIHVHVYVNLSDDIPHGNSAPSAIAGPLGRTRRRSPRSCGPASWLRGGSPDELAMTSWLLDRWEKIQLLMQQCILYGGFLKGIPKSPQASILKWSNDLTWSAIILGNPRILLGYWVQVPCSFWPILSPNSSG